MEATSELRSGAARSRTEDAQGRPRTIWSRVSDSGAGIAGVLLLFLHGLSVADVKHCGLVGFAVILCAAHGRSRARTWRMAVVYLGVVILLDYTWLQVPEALLPSLPTLGLGVSRGQAVWSWDTLGAEIVLFVLLSCQIMRMEDMRVSTSRLGAARRAEARLSDEDSGAPSSREEAASGGLEQSSACEPRMQVDDDHEVLESGWPWVCRIGLLEMNKLTTHVGAFWDMMGFLFVYLAMLVHALGVTQMGTWVFDSGKLWGVWSLREPAP